MKTCTDSIKGIEYESFKSPPNTYIKLPTIFNQITLCNLVLHISDKLVDKLVSYGAKPKYTTNDPIMNLSPIEIMILILLVK
jgi:hypothetical protein